MAEILKFPTREKQAFDFLSEQLDQLLRQKGADVYRLIMLQSLNRRLSRLAS